MPREIQIDPAPEEVVRACAACLVELKPMRRVYCSRACRKAVRHWRLKAVVVRA